MLPSPSIVPPLICPHLTDNLNLKLWFMNYIYEIMEVEKNGN